MNSVQPSEVHDAKQFYTREGQEMFMSVAEGRRPPSMQGRDALRVYGTGTTRMEAERASRANWVRAWHSLHTKATSSAKDTATQ